jgi:hypothetical protein
VRDCFSSFLRFLPAYFFSDADGAFTFEIAVTLGQEA